MPGQAQLAFDAAGRLDRSNRVDPLLEPGRTVTARCALQPIENASTSGTAPTPGRSSSIAAMSAWTARSFSGRARTRFIGGVRSATPTTRARRGRPVELRVDVGMVSDDRQDPEREVVSRLVREEERTGRLEELGGGGYGLDHHRPIVRACTGRLTEAADS